jgi:hypothetical protein
MGGQRVGRADRALGAAGPVRRLLGGDASPATFMLVRIHSKNKKKVSLVRPLSFVLSPGRPGPALVKPRSPSGTARTTLPGPARGSSSGRPTCDSSAVSSGRGGLRDQGRTATRARRPDARAVSGRCGSGLAAPPHRSLAGLGRGLVVAESRPREHGARTVSAVRSSTEGPPRQVVGLLWATSTGANAVRGPLGSGWGLGKLLGVRFLPELGRRFVVDLFQRREGAQQGRVPFKLEIAVE